MESCAVQQRTDVTSHLSNSGWCAVPFFCWRLLGLIPGGAPFSQLNRGVKDAMVKSTKLVECQFMSKTCKRLSLKNNTQVKRERRKPSTDWTWIAKGLGRSHTDSTYAGATDKTTQEDDGFGETKKKHLRQSQCASRKQWRLVTFNGTS